MHHSSPQNLALVAGATGIVGSKLVETLLAQQWQVIGLTRQQTPATQSIPLVSVDLLDSSRSAAVLAGLTDVTHIFYSAWLDAPDWSTMVEPNVAMLRNLVQGIDAVAPLRHVSLMQGYKVYGAHLGRFKTPARESDPGVAGAEFNAAQLAWLSAYQRGKSWSWSALRPGVVGSQVAGNMMNLALSIALYASLCRALVLPLRFPASPATWNSIVDHTDGTLLAAATVWAAENDAARNQAFNVNNGDLWRWSELWPAIARWFELDCAPAAALSFQQLFRDYRPQWQALAEQAGLRQTDLLQLNDGRFADFVFSWDYDMFGDGSKIRRAGFSHYRATDQMFFDLFSQFRQAKIIP